MRLPLNSTFYWLVLANAATFQQPLQVPQKPSLPFDASFDEKVKWTLEHFRIPGVAVAVVRGDETFSKGYGVSDTLNSSVTEHTLFFAGSTTKAFTSAAISLLVDDINFPEIQWDTPVNTLLPEFILSDTWSTSQMTIIDILSHRSGLPRHDLVWFANITLQESVQAMRYLPFSAPPRTTWQYCNLMYTAAAHLIETVTKQSLQSFMMENIWLPLDMTETYLSLSAAEKAHRDISQGFYIDMNGTLSSTDRVYVESIRGAGNILSSVSDYAKWISTMLNRGAPFSQKAYTTLFGAHSIVSRNPIEPFQTPTLYGLGWMSNAYKGELILCHSGAQYGYGASVVLLPHRNFGLVILGNNMNGVTAAADVLAYHLIDKELDIDIESRSDWVKRGDDYIASTQLPANIVSELYPRIPDPPLANPLNLSGYEGLYTHPSYPDIEISSNCTAYQVFPGLNRTPDLCGSLPNYNDYSRDLKIGLFHVSGTYWSQISVMTSIADASRAEFTISSEGHASWLGIEIEPLMREEKIWWKNVS